jgi:hypothetical protein
MPADLSASLAQLRAASKDLNSLCDLGAATIQQLEEVLRREMSIGIPACVLVDEEHDRSAGISYKTYLEYTRYRGTFRIAVTSGCDGMDPDDWSVKPWAECDRETKVQTLHLIPDLLEAIAKKADLQLKEARDALDSVRELVPALTPAKKGIKNGQ